MFKLNQESLDKAQEMYLVRQERLAKYVVVGTAVGAGIIGAVSYNIAKSATVVKIGANGVASMVSAPLVIKLFVFAVWFCLLLWAWYEFQCWLSESLNKTMYAMDVKKSIDNK